MGSRRIMAYLNGNTMTTAHPATTCLTWDSPLGAMVLAATDKGLVGAWFADQADRPSWAQASTHPTQAQAPHPVLGLAREQLAAYFDKRLQRFELALDTSLLGTPFQQSVWTALLTIPHGQTTSYGQIAQTLGRPKAVRAVGGAVGRNPWSVVVPCHRVVGAQGQLTGYSGGMHRKVALLALEGH